MKTSKEKLAYVRAWYVANKERAKAQQAGYRDSHRQQIRDQQKRHRAENLDAARQKDRLRQSSTSRKKTKRLSYLKHKAKIAMAGKRYNVQPHVRERKRLLMKEWLNENREMVAKKRKVWAAKNHARILAWNAVRKLVAKNQLHKESEREKEKAIYLMAEKLTLTGVGKHVVDHIIPISLGGWHHHENLQVLPDSVNGEKGAKLFWEDKEGRFKSWRDVPPHLWPTDLLPVMVLKCFEQTSAAMDRITGHRVGGRAA